MIFNKQTLRYIVLAGIFAVPFIPFLVSSSLFFPFITTKAFAWRLIVEIIFAAWLLLALNDALYRPRKSFILYVLAAFLGVVALADLLSANPLFSFWSNFERMEGFVSLLHLGAYFLVMASVMSEDLWSKWWKTSLVASALMGLVATSQILGWVDISRGDLRVDGTFGNAIYLAVYMIFHIFIALFYLVREWGKGNAKWIYGALIIFQTFVLYHTATRGAILGLIGGLVILALLNLRSASGRLAKKASAAVLVGSLLLVSGIYLARQSEFVRESPVLSRFATLSLEDLKGQGRYFVWPMAWKGFQEKPLLGWGQENFVLVFQKYYEPEMYALEPWFDRAHNIFLDWLVSAGALGLLSYLSLYGSALFLIWRKMSGSQSDKNILTALLLAYFFHNIFVFDHLVSYILFFSFLAFVASRSGGEPLWRKDLSPRALQFIATPLVIVGLISALYFVVYSPLKSNLSLIKGMIASQTPGKLLEAVSHFSSAQEASYLGRSELLERVVENATPILSNQALAMEEKNTYYSFVEQSIAEQAEVSASSSRFHLIAGSFLAGFGALERAEAHLLAAQELSPGKQLVYFELGALYINKQDPKKALETFKKAYELAPDFQEARIIYLVGGVYAGDRAVEESMRKILPESALAFDDRIVSAYYVNGRFDQVRSILLLRKELDPANSATYDAYLKQL